MEQLAQAIAYSSVGAGGLWRLAYPAGDPAIVPWIGLAGGALIAFEVPVLWHMSNVLAGVGAGVFFAELLRQNRLVGAALGGAAGYFALHNPEPQKSAKSG